MFKLPTFPILMFALVMISTCRDQAWAKASVLSGVKISENNGRTALDAELSHAESFSVTATSNPDRVVIDFGPLTFDLPPGSGQKVAGMVKAWRYGMVDPGKNRIVLDLARPVLIEHSALVPSKGKKTAHLHIDLAETSSADFAAAASGSGEPANNGALTIEPASAPAEVPHETRTKTIVIDAGHGGIDPGASSADHVREKDVVLAYALELQRQLLATGNFKVILTREDDRFLTLQQRVKVARDNSADLFIAVHADTVHDHSVRGTTIYTVSEKATDAVAEQLAEDENQADAIGGIDLGHQSPEVANVLINLAQRESRNQALVFAKTAVKSIHPLTEMTGQPLRAAAFVVLKAPDVPSVLVELGYLSSPKDEALLVSQEWRVKMAGAMTEAISHYFAPVLTAKSN